MVRDLLRRPLSPDVEDRAAARRRDPRRRGVERIEDDLTDRAAPAGTSSDAELAAYEKALADARGRAQAIANETRDKLNAEAERARKALEDELNVKLAEAEKTIAATKQAALANVRGIAIEAAAAIVERLIGFGGAGRIRGSGGRHRARSGEDAMINAEFWVAVAFVLFVALLIYMGVHRISSMRSTSARPHQGRARRGGPPEGRGAEAARRTISASTSEAEREAEAIIGSAKIEAERIAAEAKTKMEDFLARRTKMAEMKIAQAEAQALAEVRAAAAEAAVSAAERILTESTKGKVADDLIAQGIRDVKAKLN